MYENNSELNDLFLDSNIECPLTKLTFSELLTEHNLKKNNKKEFIIARTCLKENNKSNKKFIFYNSKELCREIFENSISYSYKIKIRRMIDPLLKEPIEGIEFFAVRKHETEETSINETYRAVFIGTHIDFIKNQNLRDQICDALDYLPINFNDPSKKKQKIWYSIFSILIAIFITGILFYVLETRDIFHRTFPLKNKLEIKNKFGIKNFENKDEFI